MRYKVGQIIFLNWNNRFNKLIRIYNMINYGIKGFSHVGIITEITKDNILIHEAISKGFVSSYYSKIFINNKIKEENVEVKNVRIKLTDVKKYADKYLGKPYGFLDIFGIFISFIFKFKFIKLTGASRLICSEAVARILYDASDKKIILGYKNKEDKSEYNKSFDLIDPMDIYLSEELWEKQ